VAFNYNQQKFFKISQISRPRVDAAKPFKALIFDTVYDTRRGAIIYVACFDGQVKRGDRVTSCFTGKSYEVQEVGLARPQFEPAEQL
jgi:GTP-binding protein LepA